MSVDMSFKEFFYKGGQRNKVEPGGGCEVNEVFFFFFFFKTEKIIACI